LRVRGFLRCSSKDRPHDFSRQSTAGEQSARDSQTVWRTVFTVAWFSVGDVFCTADRPRLSSGQSAPSLADSPRQLGR
jgi:hypothetical protein